MTFGRAEGGQSKLLTGQGRSRPAGTIAIPCKPCWQGFQDPHRFERVAIGDGGCLSYLFTIALLFLV